MENNNLIGKTVAYNIVVDNTIEEKESGQVVAVSQDTGGFMFCHIWTGKRLKRIYFCDIVDISFNQENGRAYEWRSILEPPPLDKSVIAFFRDGRYKNQIKILSYYSYEDKDKDEDGKRWQCWDIITGTSNEEDDEKNEDERWVPPDSTLWRSIDDNIPLDIISNEISNRYEILDL